MICSFPNVTQLVSGRPQSRNHYPKLTPFGHSVGQGQALHCSGPQSCHVCPEGWDLLFFEASSSPVSWVYVSGSTRLPGCDTTRPASHPGFLYGVRNDPLTQALPFPAAQASYHLVLTLDLALSPLPTRKGRSSQNPGFLHHKCVWPGAGGAGALWEILKLERVWWLWGPDRGQCGQRVCGGGAGKRERGGWKRGQMSDGKGFVGST